MMKINKNYFTKTEKRIWMISVILVLLSFLLFDRGNTVALVASLVGVTSLIYNAKGNPIAQVLMIIFSILYGYISFGCAYYGEMVTYLGMTMPMALLALISWLKHPYQGNISEVSVRKIKKIDLLIMSILTVIVTAVFFFILKYLGTVNLLVSTLSVTTSFIAVYFTFLRSPYYAIGYAANDVVLIVLWAMMSLKDSSYISVLACFIAFLLNDIYGFISWKNMERRQSE